MKAKPPILYAEDDENDASLFKRAFKEAEIRHPLLIVPDGNAAVEYLAGKGSYMNREKYPLPCLILLDLKMPGKSGLEVLKWIRARPSSVSTVPVLMLTSSSQDGGVHRSYLQGANGYLVKPTKMDDVLVMARAIKDYWLILNLHSSIEAGE
jgi:CheY-like chemotaxis protein